MERMILSGRRFPQQKRLFLLAASVVLLGVMSVASAAHAYPVPLPPLLAAGQQAPVEPGTVTIASPPAGGEEPQPASSGFWHWAWDYFINGASITVGVGLRQSDMTVTRTSDGAQGRIAQRDESAYFFSYSTRASFIRETNFGYAFMLNLSHFSMDKQEVDKDVYVDLGTRVRGRYAYVVPTLFYQWGEHRYQGKFMRLGIGVGVGVATFTGDIILTESAIPNDRVSVENGNYRPYVATSAFWEARWRHWGLRFSVAGPKVQQGVYDIQLADIALNLGYSFYF